MKKHLQILTFIILAVSFSSGIKAQVWNTVGNGISPLNFVGHTIVTSADGTDLYVGCMPTSTFISKNTEIAKWDGNFWLFAPKIHNFLLRDLEVVNGTVYVLGWSSPSYKILKLTNSGWVDISPANLTGWVAKLTRHGNNLVVYGDFTATGGIVDIMKFDGTTFSAYPPVPKLTYIISAAAFQGELLISGQRSGMSLTSDSTLYKLNNTLNVWEGQLKFIQGTGNSLSAKGIMPGQNDLYLYENNHVLKLVNDTATYIASLGHMVNEHVAYNNKVYAVGTQNTGLNNMSIIDGSSVFAVANTPDSLKAVNMLNNEIYVIDKYATSWNGITYNHAFRTDFSTNTARLDLNTYLDKNFNGNQDSAEPSISHTKIDLDGSVSFYSDNAGKANAILLPGQHTIDDYQSVHKLGKNVTKSLQTPINLNLVNQQTTVFDLPFVNSVQYDVGVNLYGYKGKFVVYGFQENVKVEVSNYGYDSLLNIQVNIQLPPTVSLVKNIPGATISGQNIAFQVPALAPEETYSANYTIKIDTATHNLGDKIHTYASIVVANDADLSDNTDTLTQWVIGAFDPNDKQASAEFIELGTESIDYHIRFQNTGSDTAYKVVVTDSLDLSSPITSVIINSASHPYSFFVAGNMLVWEFDNILLPDSTTDLLGSQGYVNFTANLNPNLALGDTVKNNADIYFDFQHPIRTNTAKTTVIQTFRINENSNVLNDVAVYPNPTQSHLKIKLNQPSSATLSLYDVSGKLMMQKVSGKAHVHMLNVASLPKGTYVLKVTTQRAEQAAFKILIE